MGETGVNTVFVLEQSVAFSVLLMARKDANGPVCRWNTFSFSYVTERNRISC